MEITKELLIELSKMCISQAEMSRKIGCCGATITCQAKSLGILKEIQGILKENKRNAPFVPKLGKYNFSNIFYDDTEESFYLAGFLAADGCVHNRNYHYSMALTLAEKDADHVYKMRDLLKSNHPIEHDSSFLKETGKYYKNCGFSICSKSLVQSLERFNIVERKSLIYEFPKWIIDHPLSNHFVRGYIDGDGCWKLFEDKNKELKKHTGLNILGTYDCLNSIKTIFNKNCNIERENKQIRELQNNTCALDYGGAVIVNKIADYLYKDATIYLNRKKETVDQIRVLLTYNVGRGHSGKSEITKQDIFNAARQSKTQNDMAKILNCTGGNIVHWLDYHDIRSKIKTILKQNILKEQLFDTARECETQAEISKKLNLSPKKICLLLQKYNIQSDIQNILCDNKKNNNEAKELQELKDLCEAAKTSTTQVEISDKLNCSKAIIRLKLEKYGIKSEIEDILNQNKPDLKEQLFQIAKSSRTQTEIADKMDRSKENVGFLMRKFNVKQEIQIILSQNRLDFEKLKAANLAAL
jgi:hypothetical protein